jgi:4-hydroxy-tetrahydrodipicolinate reductase
VRARNFSLGINVMLGLVAEAIRRLPGYDVELLDLHHNRKRDAPSGTALWIAETAAEALGAPLDERAIYHREGKTGPRPRGAIGIQTLRAGDSVGEHTVYIAGPGERLEISHRALSRDNFAAGAVRAARWIRGRPPGLYSLTDVLESEA